MKVAYGSIFTDPGATASDNVDGDITSGIVTAGKVNTNAIGSYKLTYNVHDEAGNQADEVTRIANVVKAEATVVDGVRIYSDGNSIYVSIKKIKTSAHLSVLAMNGKTVYQTSALSEGVNSIIPNLISGGYIVRLQVDDNRYTTKVVLTYE